MSSRPEGLYQAVARDDTIRVEQQNPKQGALFCGADVDDATFVKNLQTTQDSKLHVLADHANSASRKPKTRFADALPSVALIL